MASVPLSAIPGGTALASICGFDNSQDVGLYDGSLGVTRAFVDAHEAPVGNLRWKGDLLQRYSDPGNVNAMRWCSGTLITEDLFVTAGHCLETRPLGWIVPRAEGTDMPISRAEVATNMRVEFDYQLDPNGNDQEPQPFSVVEVVEDRLGELDYAIVRLEDAPGERLGITRIGTADAPVGGSICIIGHPGGQQKRIDAGTIRAYEEVRVFYDDISTEGGSAGSGILSSSDGALVGIHTNGGCDDPSIGSNFGLAISGLLQVSPILQDLARA
jgi:V8-like Glu-specific endopeptidase